MNLLHNRPLCTTLCVLLGGFAVFARLSLPFRIALIVGGLLILYGAWHRRRKNGFFPFVCAALFLISFLCSYLYFDLWFYADRRFEGAQVQISATVSSIRYAQGYGGLMEVRTKSVNHAPLSHYRLYVETEESCTDLQIGNTVYLSGVLRPFENTDHDGGEIQRMLADGINAQIHATSFSFEHDNRAPLTRALRDIRETVSSYLCESTQGADGGLLCALITGDRSRLSGQVKLDFSRLGISHILAVSGMHLAILTLALGTLLRALRVPRLIQIPLSSAFVLGYMALTGFSSSVMRAGIMMLLQYALFFCFARADALTNLSLSVFGICLFCPHAVFDLSLLLSALATAGILAGNEFLNAKRKSGRPSFLLNILMSMFVSVCALASTMLVSVYTFARICTLSPLSGGFFGTLITFYLFSATICLPLSVFLPTKPLLGFLGKIIVKIAGIFAEPTFLTVPTDFLPVRICTLIFTGFLLVLLLTDIRRRRLMLTLVCILYSAVFVSGGICAAVSDANRADTYARSQNSEWLFFTGKGAGCVVDLARDNSEDFLLLRKKLTEQHAEYGDTLVLTRYAARAERGLPLLLSGVSFRRIYLPVPANDTETRVLAQLRSALSEYRTQILTYETGEVVHLGEWQWKSRWRDGTDILFTAMRESQQIAYLSRGSVRRKTRALAQECICESDTVIFGARGTKGSVPLRIHESADADKILILSGDTLPEQDSLFRFEKAGRVVRAPQEYRFAQ